MNYEEIAKSIISLVEMLQNRTLTPHDRYFIGRHIQKQSGVYFELKESKINNHKI